MTITLTPSLPSLHGADFSADRTHRLLLWRIERLTGRYLSFLMLNPSVADESRGDQTTGCNQERARRQGYDGIVQANLYTYRATSPRELKAAGYPGARDEHAYQRLADLCEDVVLAWGAHARRDDAWHAVAFLRRCARPPRLYTLGLTTEGMPRHPLRVPYLQALLPLPAWWGQP